MLTSKQHTEIKEIISKSLDNAEKTWTSGGYKLVEFNESAGMAVLKKAEIDLHFSNIFSLPYNIAIVSAGEIVRGSYKYGNYGRLLGYIYYKKDGEYHFLNEELLKYLIELLIQEVGYRRVISTKKLNVSPSGLRFTPGPIGSNSADNFGIWSVFCTLIHTVSSKAPSGISILTPYKGLEESVTSITPPDGPMAAEASCVASPLLYSCLMYLSGMMVVPFWS